MSSAVAATLEQLDVTLRQQLDRLAARQRGEAIHAPLRQPVALLGPGDGGTRETEAARAIACCLASAGLAIVCGGRGGVMRAAAQGAQEAGGISLGILPEADLSAANEFLTVALPTGIGEIRNTLIVRSAVCVIAVGGGVGTLSEMAFAAKWNKPLIALYPEPHAVSLLPGAHAASDWHEALAHAVEILLTA